MPLTGKTIDHNSLANLTRQAAPRVVSAIRSAAARTGVDFAYLMQKASAESSFDARAKSKGSSATGLYQFIDSTWLGMVRDFGHKYGMGQYADKIDKSGRVADPALRKEILALRNDPEKASFMAAEFAAGNETYLRQHLGKNAAIGSTELYLAHFLGAGSATAFLKAMEDNPLSNAADLFPKAARANRNVFYDTKTGQPRTLAGIYDFFARKFDQPGGATARDGLNRLAPPPVKPMRAAPVEQPAFANNTLVHQMQMDNALLEVLMPAPAAPRQEFFPLGRNDDPMTIPAQTMSALVRDPANLMLIARMGDEDSGRHRSRYNN